MSNTPTWRAASAFWPGADESQFVDTPGGSLHVRISGAGEDVLLLHGAGASGHSFAGVASALTARYRLIIPDLPGQGFSALLPPEQVGLPEFADHLISLMAKIEATPRWIIGHSAGAALATQFALQATERPEGILCINAAFNPFGSIAAPIFSKAARLLARNQWLPRLLASPALRWRATPAMLSDTGSSVDPLMSQCYDTLLSNPDHIAGTLRMMAGWDLPPLLARLSQLEMPIWLIAAEGDKTIPPERSLSVLPKLKNGRSFRLPGLGHLAHEEDPEAIAKIFLEMTA